jgi:hypothetical protein
VSLVRSAVLNTDAVVFLSRVLGSPESVDAIVDRGWRSFDQ